MPILDMCVQMYMNKKHTKFIKIINISLLLYMVSETKCYLPT